MFDRTSRPNLACGLLAAGIAAAAAQPAVAQDDEQAAAISYFEHAYSSRCQPLSETRGLLDGPEFPRRHEIAYKPSYASEGDPDETAIVYEFFCTSGAYNVQMAYVLVEDGYFEPLTFTVPALDIVYEEGNTDAAVESVKVAGYYANLTTTNAEFDPATSRIVSHSNWRGLGDAWSEATWEFRDGAFVLKRYVVDASYDGKLEPQLTLDY